MQIFIRTNQLFLCSPTEEISVASLSSSHPTALSLTASQKVYILLPEFQFKRGQLLKTSGEFSQGCAKKKRILIRRCGLPRWHSGKESACQCWRLRRCRFNPWVRKIPWSRKWQPTPLLLPGESHGQRILVGYSLECCKESDTTGHAGRHIRYYQ